MQLDQRDLLTVQYVSRFGQLSSTHIQQLIFSDLTSHTPAARTLLRLVDRRYLSRIERRTVGGSRGGSGQYVYILGSEGHKLFREGRWAPARAINYHSLAIADCYVMLTRLARQGKLRIGGYSTEPDCHVTIGRYELKPDLYAELSRPDGSNPLNIMVEIDQGTQGQRQITSKLERYWNAYLMDDPLWPIESHQIVVFVAIDDVRAQELRWVLARWVTPDEASKQHAAFKVHTLASLEAMLS